MAAAAKIAALATTAAAVKIGVDAVKAAGNYESSLSQLKQASGATADEMAQMSAKAQELGRSNDFAGVTSADAAKTMTELSKAGLSVKDTLDASKGAMALAKAGNIEFADAAVIAASALNAFGLQGDKANEVADTLAAGANASQAELSDLALGLQQSATVAKQFKLSLNENVTALSLFANNGIKGSDAGTSLKTMLIALSKPSKASANAMKEIGFNAYDAQGKFVGLREMSIRLQRGLAGLTDEQKQNTLATIFGTDAFRAAAVLSDNAGKSYDGMSKSVGKVGAAQEAARAQMGPYERAMEGLNNTLEDLSVQVGTKLLPSVTGFVNFLSGSAITTFNMFSAALSGQAPVLTGLGVGLLAYGAATTGVTAATKAWTMAQAALNLVMKANPVGLLIAGVTGLVAAFVAVTGQTNNSTSATKRLDSARRELAAANDQAKQAEDRLREAQVSAQGAALSVERAQRTYNEAVRQFGPRSLEAREAAYSLKRAQESLGAANRETKAATDGNTSAQQNQANKKAAVVSAESSKRAAFYSTRDAVLGQTGAVKRLGLSLDQLNGKKVSYSVAEITEANYKKEHPNAPFAKNAIGTNYSAGGTTLVGEHGPELVNLPRGAQVHPNYKTRQMQPSGGDTIINLYGNVTNETPQAAEAFWGRIDKQQRLAARGLA
ncbi:hypothetical protein GCM10009648_07400 [Tsukamurella spumae]